MNLSIKEAKDAKRALQSTIALALRQFSDDTGLAVDSVSVNCISVNKMGGASSSAYNVQVEVKL